MGSVQEKCCILAKFSPLSSKILHKFCYSAKIPYEKKPFKSQFLSLHSSESVFCSINVLKMAYFYKRPQNPQNFQRHFLTWKRHNIHPWAGVRKLMVIIMVTFNHCFLPIPVWLQLTIDFFPYRYG